MKLEDKYTDMYRNENWDRAAVFNSFKFLQNLKNAQILLFRPRGFARWLEYLFNIVSLRTISIIAQFRLMHFKFVTFRFSTCRQQQSNRKPKTYVSSSIFTHLHVFSNCNNSSSSNTTTAATTTTVHFVCRSLIYWLWKLL